MFAAVRSRSCLQLNKHKLTNFTDPAHEKFMIYSSCYLYNYCIAIDCIC